MSWTELVPAFTLVGVGTLLVGLWVWWFLR